MQIFFLVHSSAMPTETLSDTIVEDTVDEQLDQQGEISTDQLGKNVEDAVEEKTEVLQEHFGDAVDDLVGEITDKEESWHTSMKKINGDHTLGDTEEQGAAGITHMGSRQVILSKEGARYEVDDEGYRERVKGHEEIHQNDQAASYNQEEITYVDKQNRLKTVGVNRLVEWQPSSKANKRSDLTAEYQQHVDEGEELKKSLGSDGMGLMEGALKSGDMKGLQEQIIQKQRTQILEMMKKGKEVFSQN